MVALVISINFISYASDYPQIPAGEKPITVNQIDSLLAVPDFYNPAYKYKTSNGTLFYDSLGVLGGSGSGGFFDTWRGQTQILLPFDSDKFSINQTDSVSFKAESVIGSLYWMTLAMVQEYFNVDMQYLMAIAAKEIKIGLWNELLNKPAYSENTGGEGLFQTSAATSLDRALACPHFYPFDSLPLISSTDVTSFLSTSGLTISQWQQKYLGPDIMPSNSAHIVNSTIFAVNIYQTQYNLFAYATELCWNEFLLKAKVNKAGSIMMLLLHNQGINGGQNILAMLKADMYEQFALNPDIISLLTNGNNNYKSDIIKLINKIVQASRSHFNGAPVSLSDGEISKKDLLRLFFGDSGTVDKQGNGGLLLHFRVDRTQVCNTLDQAFNKLKGNAPSTSGKEAISFRYDFLTVLRTVKTYFNDKPLYSRPLAGDVLATIIANSKTVGCGSNAIKQETHSVQSAMLIPFITSNANQLFLTVATPADLKVTCKLYDLKGTCIFTKSGFAIGRILKIALGKKQVFTPGTYIVRISAGEFISMDSFTIIR
jgi:hypothetical protein